MDLLSHRIELQGFEKSYDPEADGDCFYKAAAFQLGREGADLKNEVFDYLAQNQYDSQGQNRLDFVCGDDIQNQDVPSDWSEALTSLRRSCANEMIIRALSESLHCKITIITTSGETPDSYVKVIVPPEQHGTPRYALYFGHTGDHYFALKEKILHYRGESFISCCSLIYSLNEDKEKVNACVDVLCRYLDNIRNNPNEEKYQKIKQNNKIFQERVAPVKGATEFLLACGFEYKVFPGEEACSDCERLNVFKEALVSVVDWMSKLDRCLKPSLPDSNEKSEVWLQPHEFSTFLNFTLPVEYLIGEMFWWQEIDKAMQSDLDHLWSREHITGSYAEGLSIPLSLLHKTGNNSSAEDWKIISADLDIMLVKETLVTVSDEQIPIFDIIQSGYDPRYFLLRLTEQWKKVNATFSDSVYLHQPFLMTPGIATKILGTILGPEKVEDEPLHERIHGPARQLFIKGESVMSFDKTVVFEYPDAWPESAMDWLIRPRITGWPSPALVQHIFDSGCHLAPVGRGKRACEPVERVEYLSNPRAEISHQNQDVEETLMDEREWRISFSLAENKLGQSLSPVQRRIMVLLKVIKKAYLSDHDVISTYILKNIFFWECENRENDFWREDNTAECLLSLLDRLVECLKTRHLPHYIMPESNLLMTGDPVKLDEAAKSVLEVRENIFQKTVSFLARLQSMMFQARDFVTDFNDTKVRNKPNSNEETNNLIYSLCQLYKKEIVDEHSVRNNENAMKGQHIMSIINGCLSMHGILEQFLSESLFLQSTVSISDLIPFFSLWSKYKDAFANEMTKMEYDFERLEIMCNSQLSNLLLYSHLCYMSQIVFAVVKELYEKVINSPHFVKSMEYYKKDLTSASNDKIRLFEGYIEGILPIIQKHKSKILGYMKNICTQLGNFVKVFFSSISPLRLRVHESLLARSYCKLWFASNDQSSEHSEDRESFTLFVREEFKSCPLDEEFIKLSLMFFDEMIMGRDSCQVVPETPVMEEVKEIQQRIAHESVKFCKTVYLFFNEFVKDGGIINDFTEMLDNTAPFTTIS